MAFGGSRVDYMVKIGPKTLNILGSISKKLIPPRRLKIFIILLYKVSRLPLEEKEVDANSVISDFTIWLVNTQGIHGHPTYLLCTEHYTVHCTLYCTDYCTQHCTISCDKTSIFLADPNPRREVLISL